MASHDRSPPPSILVAAIAPPIVLCSVLLALVIMMWYRRRARLQAVEGGPESAPVSFFFDKSPLPTPGPTPTSATPLNHRAGVVPVPLTATRNQQRQPPEGQQSQEQQPSPSARHSTSSKRFFINIPAWAGRLANANGSHGSLGSSRHGRRRSRADPVLPEESPSVHFNAEDMLAPPPPRRSRPRSIQQIAAAAASLRVPTFPSLTSIRSTSTAPPRHPPPPPPSSPPPQPPTPSSPRGQERKSCTRKRVRPLPPLPRPLLLSGLGSDSRAGSYLGSERKSAPGPSPPPPQPPPLPLPPVQDLVVAAQPQFQYPIVLQPNRLGQQPQREQEEEQKLQPQELQQEQEQTTVSLQPPPQIQIQPQPRPVSQTRQQLESLFGNARWWGRGGRQHRESYGLPPPYSSHARQ